MQIVNRYRRASNFTISEHKIILWSKRNILHGRLDDIRTANLEGVDLMLNESDFVIKLATNVNQKKKIGGRLQEVLK